MHSDCGCFIEGTQSGLNECNNITGQCPCRSFADGRECGVCKRGYYMITEREHHACTGKETVVLITKRHVFQLATASRAAHNRKPTAIPTRAAVIVAPMLLDDAAINRRTIIIIRRLTI